MAVMKAGSYIFIIFLLASSLLIFLSFMSELMNKNNYGMQRSWKKMRRVDKHFFFDLLPSFDLPLQNSNTYQPSKFIEHSQFTSIVDRVLLSRYLVDRFAYRSFIQFGCRLDRSIHHLLPDTTVTVRHCVDRRDGMPIAYLNTSHAQSRLFDLIVADIENISESLLESYMNILDVGGTVVLTGSNNFILESNKTKEMTTVEAALLHQIILIRGRHDLDLATLDADTGLTVIYKRRNSAYLDIQTAESALSDLGPGTGPGPTEPSSTGTTLSAVYLNAELRQRILNLMRFEDLHDWLAPTGHVDAVTAFGGDKAFTAFREAEQYEVRCMKVAADLAQQEAALRCLQDASSVGRLSLRSRWHLALLLMQSNRMVEAVTAMGELSSLNPMWYKWMLSQLSSNIAQSLISSKSNRSGDKELLQIPVATPVEKQMPHSVITSDPPTGVMTPTADTLKAVTLTESDPTSTRENTTSESGAVTASGTVPLPVTAGPEGVEGAAAVGVGTGNPPPPREGQMRTRGMGRRGSRRRKVIPPVPQAIGGGGDEASNVG